MNKKGQEHQIFFAFEMILGILVAGILISLSANFDSLSNINQVYAQEDLKLLAEAIEAAPGSIHYDYNMKSLYNVDIQKEDIKITKTDGIIDGYTYYNLTLEKQQGSDQVTVEKHA